MAVNSRFRTLAFALRGHITDTYALLSAVDAVMDLDEGFVHESTQDNLPTITTPDGKATWNFTYNRWDFKHDDLVSMVLDNDTIMGHMADSKKINAIKELRTVARCGLKEAKEAVEDSRVSVALSDPWGRWARTEPPF